MYKKILPVLLCLLLAGCGRPAGANSTAPLQSKPLPMQSSQPASRQPATTSSRANTAVPGSVDVLDVSLWRPFTFEADGVWYSIMLPQGFSLRGYDIVVDGEEWNGIYGFDDSVTKMGWIHSSDLSQYEEIDADSIGFFDEHFTGEWQVLTRSDSLRGNTFYDIGDFRAISYFGSGFGPWTYYCHLSTDISLDFYRIFEDTETQRAMWERIVLSMEEV